MAREYSKDQLLNKALNYINYRMRSKKEVEEKLCALGAEPEIKAELLALLENNGLIDDEKFIGAALKYYVELKQFGPMRTRTELARKGFGRHLIEDALGNYAEDNDEYSEEGQALEILERRYPAGRALPEDGKILAHLARRGFSLGAASKALATLKKSHSGPGGEGLSEAED